jgi:hypothetical protein
MKNPREAPIKGHLKKKEMNRTTLWSTMVDSIWWSVILHKTRNKPIIKWWLIIIKRGLSRLHNIGILLIKIRSSSCRDELRQRRAHRSLPGEVSCKEEKVYKNLEWSRIQKVEREGFSRTK